MTNTWNAFDADPSECGCDPWFSENRALSAIAAEAAVEEARRALSAIAADLHEVDGYTPGGRIYGVVYLDDGTSEVFRHDL